MKAINQKVIVKSYFSFSVFMVVMVIMSLLMSYCLLSTSVHEAARIESRSEIFDRTFATQVNVVDRVDSLYNYISLINSDVRINDIVVQNAVSTRKMSLLNDLVRMDDKDVILYKSLMNSVNKFLSVKDSIRITGNSERTLRDDLQRCITDDRQASRKLSLEGLQTVNKPK